MQATLGGERVFLRWDTVRAPFGCLILGVRCLLLIPYNKCRMNNRQIDPKVSIGHVHLKAADLERALSFYCGVLGFALTQRYGTGAAFISAGG